MNHAEKIKQLYHKFTLAACGNDFQLSNQIKAKLDAAIDDMQTEIDRLKIVPMKYRRMTFNAELQEEVSRRITFDEAHGAWYAVGADLAGLRWADFFAAISAAMKSRGDKSMAELQKEAQDQFATHIQPSLPPLPEGAGDYFLDGGRWVRCNDSGQL